MACDTRKPCMRTFLQHRRGFLGRLRLRIASARAHAWCQHASHQRRGSYPIPTCPPRGRPLIMKVREERPRRPLMPIATPEIYAQMLDRAKQQGFAYPAINVTSSQTLNAALKGFADAESDGIVQISTGGAEYLSGQSVKG